MFLTVYHWYPSWLHGNKVNLFVEVGVVSVRAKVELLKIQSCKVFVLTVGLCILKTESIIEKKKNKTEKTTL